MLMLWQVTNVWKCVIMWNFFIFSDIFDINCMNEEMAGSVPQPLQAQQEGRIQRENNFFE